MYLRDSQEELDGRHPGQPLRRDDQRHLLRAVRKPFQAPQRRVWQAFTDDLVIGAIAPAEGAGERLQLPGAAVDLPVRSAAHLWDFVVSSNPLGAAMVADLTDDQTTEARRVLDGMLRERSGGGPEAVHTINVGVGTA